MIYTDIMVDCETTGTRPDRSAMIELAAVKFNLEDRTVSPSMFNRCMKIPKNRYWDESTREWWGKQPEVLKAILTKGEDPNLVMKDFVDWVQPGRESLRFWAKPTTFDFMFVTSYLNDYNQPTSLFDFREATDMRSFFRGLYYPNPIDTSDEPDFKGVAHNAVVDCLNQIKLVFHHADKVELIRPVQHIEGEYEVRP